MPAIAYEYPAEIAAIREGLERFVRTEVMPRHHDNAELFGVRITASPPTAATARRC